MPKIYHNIGVLAHVDSGKTTLTEQLLYLTGTVRTAGSVDAGTTATDSLSIERRRGISVRTSTATAEYNGVTVKKADRFYPSSKTCSVCGNVKNDLKLKDRTYRCDKCGAVIDRDYNASLNLLSLLSNIKIGSSSPEFTPADLTALLSRFKRNRITTSKVETGR